ncbi:MAG TPA: hypothetical protein VHM30_13320 [Gemmatimonadaceae bacterium]|nr:hypothetical protein [Gemmatimonadaceae bacterium]
MQWLALAVFVLLAASAVLAGRSRERFRALDLSLVPASIPVVVESALDFWPAHRYSSPGRRVVYPLDWDLALDSASAPSSVQEYKLMALFASEGYLTRDVVRGDQWLCSMTRFAVVDDPLYLWRERRIGDGWSVRELGKAGPATVALVERLGTAPVRCAADAAVTR